MSYIGETHVWKTGKGCGVNTKQSSVIPGKNCYGYKFLIKIFSIILMPRDINEVINKTIIGVEQFDINNRAYWWLSLYSKHMLL